MDLSGIPLSPALVTLVEAEKEEFEAVLGRSVTFGRANSSDAAWVIEKPERRDAAPQLRWDSPTRLVSVAGSEADFVASMNALHSLAARRLTAVSIGPSQSVGDAIGVIRDEIANTYPSFGIRGLNWDEICNRHLCRPPESSEFADFAAAWIAELGDAHTAIKTSTAGGFTPPYRGSLEPDGVRLSEVPPDSAAWAAGVRTGWIVRVDDVRRLMTTVGATPQQRAQVRARRALSCGNGPRTFSAYDPGGAGEAEWDEHPTETTLANTVSVHSDREGNRTVRIRAFAGQVDLHSVFDDVIASTGRSNVLTVDLRGNTGGSILQATSLRDRFLRERTAIGYVAFTDGRGGLAPKQQRSAEPSERSRWGGKLRILIDAMTYSASEDFVLGLQGLEHVRVVGEVSGGGSGRPRRIPLLPGLDLTISTAITYDRQGSPVEFFGIRPDGG